MEEKARGKLTRVLEVVLEQLAFMFGEAVEKEELSGKAERYLHAIMKFKGAQSGEIGIAVPSEIGMVLTSNILGIEEGEEVVEEKSVDALKELLNIVCGQFLTTVFGEGPVFDLSVPEVKELDREGWERMRRNPEVVGMVVEELPLLAHASMQG